MKSTPDSHDPDWPRYPETILIFATKPELEIDLRSVVTPAAVSALARAGLAGPFVIMTAFDPGGENLPASENERRQRELESTLTKRGYRFTTVDCCSPDRSHCECSVAVTMPQDEALALARELGQIAIFWFDGTSFWIIGAALKTDPVMLPRSS
jgi:hypothetical protein